MTAALATKPDVRLSNARQEHFKALHADSCSEHLIVDRRDIQFWNTSPHRVRVEITVRNSGRRRSVSTPMFVQSAPLGAFVTWAPLATVMIPELDPNESHTAELEVEQTRRTPRTNCFSNDPPKRLLTALASEDQPSQPSKEMSLLGLMLGTQGITDDVFALLGHTNPHWAGNINVFIGNRAVERHAAKALRIYPGTTNLAMFIVGAQNRKDAYQFRVDGADELWQVQLYRTRNAQEILDIRREEDLIRESTWLTLECEMLVLAVTPPETAGEGEVQIQVTQQSTMQEAIVEFSFDASAIGPGCFVA